jgi:hypothetical protein
MKVASEQVLYLVSFLSILVDRAGGFLVIENLSDYAEKNMQLEMDLRPSEDRVILRIHRTEGAH